MRQAECLHSLAKTRCRPAFSNAAKEESSNDGSEKRERDRFWNRRLQGEERGEVSRFCQVVETVCGQAGHWDRLDGCSRVALTRRPGEGAFAKKMHMQMRNAFTRIRPAIDNDAVTVR